MMMPMKKMVMAKEIMMTTMMTIMVTMMQLNLALRRILIADTKTYRSKEI